MYNYLCIYILLKVPTWVCVCTMYVCCCMLFRLLKLERASVLKLNVCKKQKSLKAKESRLAQEETRKLLPEKKTKVIKDIK